MRSLNICAMLLPLCSLQLVAQAPDTLWTKTYGGDSDDIGYSVQQTFDGGYIVVGETRSFSAGGADVWLLKTGDNGDTIWTKRYGGMSDDIGYSVQQTTDSGFVIAGLTFSSGTGNSDIWLLKTNAIGDTLWTQTYGGTLSDEGYSVCQTADGGYVITGSTCAGTYFWLLKTDVNGDTLWTKTYGEFPWNIGLSVQQTSDGGYILAGYTWVGMYSLGYLAKTDSVGDSLWTKTFSFADCGFYSVLETSDEEYILSGFSGSDALLLKTDDNGDTLWTKTYGNTQGSDYGMLVQHTSDGGYIVAGMTQRGNSGPYDFYLIKTNAFGDTLWTKTIGGSFDDKGWSGQQTSDGGYILTGYTNSFGGTDSDVWLIKTEYDIGIKEDQHVTKKQKHAVSIFSGPLRLPEGKRCRVFDITGRVVAPNKIRPGVYFIEVEGRISQKAVKVK